MPYVIQDIGPAFEARFGDGRRGVFTAEAKDCEGRGGCTYYGTFRSDDGSLVREDVLMATGGGVSGVGDVVPAIDTNDRAAVYPPDGGWDWLLVAAFALAIPAVSVAWLVSLIWRLRHRS